MLDLALLALTVLGVAFLVILMDWDRIRRDNRVLEIKLRDYNV